MTSSAIHASGALFQVGDGGGTEVFTTVAEVKNIDGPNMSMDILDVTAHQTSGYWRQKIAGHHNPGQITLDLNFVPAGATHKNAAGGLLYLFNNRTRNNFKLVFPDVGATTWSFAGFVTGFKPGANTAEALTASVTIELTDAPTLV